MFFGTIGFFIFMMFLFVRFLPAINIFEIKDLWHRTKHERKKAAGKNRRAGRRWRVDGEDALLRSGG